MERYLLEERTLAHSEGETAPEHRMRLVLRREFDADGLSVQLVVRCGRHQVGLLDARQGEILNALLERALPELRDAEKRADADWNAWSDEGPTSGG